MDAIEQLKEDVREGRMDAERLLDIIAMLQRQVETLQRQLNVAQQRIAVLEKNAGPPAASGTAKVDQPFSMPPRKNGSRSATTRKTSNSPKRAVAVGCPAATKSSWLSAPCRVIPKAYPRETVSCRTAGLCGVWNRAGPS